jgi:LPS-assembly lipoprotein
MNIIRNIDMPENYIMSSANSFRWLILILALLVNHGCGFQLRGSLDLSEDMSPLYIQQNSSFELARDLKLSLAKTNIVVADDATEANSQLTLLSENRHRRVLSVDGNGRAIEYLLTYTVNIIIKIKQSKEIKESVSLSRSLLFDPEAVLAVTNESEILYRDMQKNAARLILLKLQARASNQEAAEGKPIDSSITGQKRKEEQRPLNSTGKSSTP